MSTRAKLSAIAMAVIVAAGVAPPARAQDKTLTLFAAASMKNAIDDVNARMIPRSNGAGGTDIEGKSSEGASGGGGIPGGSAPHDDARK